MGYPSYKLRTTLTCQLQKTLAQQMAACVLLFPILLMKKASFNQCVAMPCATVGPSIIRALREQTCTTTIISGFVVVARERRLIPTSVVPWSLVPMISALLQSRVVRTV